MYEVTMGGQKSSPYQSCFPWFIIQVYVSQNTTILQNTNLIYFRYKIMKKRTKYFIQENIQCMYINFGVNWHMNKKNEHFNKNS